MFSNFGSKDFAKVLLVDEMSSSSVMSIVKFMMRDGVESKVISDFINIQRDMLGLEYMGYESYLDILEDELVIGGKDYYGKCEELKIVLVLYSVEYRESEGGRVDVFNVFKILKTLEKFLNRTRDSRYNFDEYKELLRKMM